MSQLTVVIHDRRKRKFIPERRSILAKVPQNCHSLAAVRQGISHDGKGWLMPFIAFEKPTVSSLNLSSGVASHLFESWVDVHQRKIGEGRTRHRDPGCDQSINEFLSEEVIRNDEFEVLQMVNLVMFGAKNGWLNPSS